MRRGLTYLQIVVLIALAAVVISTALYLGLQEELAARRRGRGDRPGPPPGVFLLPGKGYDVTEILLRAPERVQAVLGAPASVEGGVDVFQVGVELRVRYADGLAAGLLVSAPGARRNERAVRRWLKIPGGDPVLVGDRRLRVGPADGGGDGIEIAVEDGRFANPALDLPLPAAPRAAKAPRPTARELLRSFPARNPFVEASCRRATAGARLEWTCVGELEAKVLWATDAARSFEELTLVTVPVAAADEDACRRWFEQSVPDATAVARRTRSGAVEATFLAGSIQYLYAWDPQWSGPGSSCSIVACRTGAGGVSACRP